MITHPSGLAFVVKIKLIIIILNLIISLLHLEITPYDYLLYQQMAQDRHWIGKKGGGGNTECTLKMV